MCTKHEEEGRRFHLAAAVLQNSRSGRHATNKKQQLTPNREGKRPGVAAGSTHRLLGSRREEEKYLRSRKLSYEEGEGAGATAADLLVSDTRLVLRFAEKIGKRKERSTGSWMEAGARGRSEDCDRGWGRDRTPMKRIACGAGSTFLNPKSIPGESDQTPPDLVLFILNQIRSEPNSNWPNLGAKLYLKKATAASSPAQNYLPSTSPLFCRSLANCYRPLLRGCQGCPIELREPPEAFQIARVFQGGGY